MNFLSPPMLAALAGLALPIALHLLRRESGTPAEVGTLRFLENLPTPRRRWSVPQDWPLLLLRCLAAALLAFLFARPLLEGERPERIVVIDRSASTGGHGVLASERRAASAQGGMGNENTTVLELGSELRPAAAETASAGRADFTRLADWARGHFDGRDARKAELFVHSDLQTSNLPVTVPHWPEGLKVTFVPQAHPQAANIALTQVRLLDWNARTGKARVEARWKVFGSLPDRDIALSFQASDLRGTTASPLAPVKLSAKLATGQAVAELSCGATPAAVFEAQIEDANDPWSFDDRRGTVSRLYRARAAVIEAGVPTSGAEPCASYFLAKAWAAEAAEEKAFTAERLNQLPANLDGFQLIALCNPRELDADTLRRLSDFVQKGGGLLVFTGPKTAPAAPGQLAGAGLLPITLGAAKPQPRVAARWDAGVLGSAVEGADPADLTVLCGFQTQAADGAAVLAETADGSPLIASKAAGSGRIVLANFAPERNLADFPLNPFFVPIMRALASHTSGEADLALGEGELEEPGAGRVAQVRGRLLYLNPPAAESDPRFSNIEEFSARLGLDTTGKKQPAIGVAGREIWPWIGLGLLAALLLESLIILLRKPRLAA